MYRRNYRSDFDFILKLKSCTGEVIGWPEVDWTARFYTPYNKANAYVASCIGGECINCYNDGGQIHIVCDNHHLGMGQLMVDFTAIFPDSSYPDGNEKVLSSIPLDIELVRDATCCPTAAEVESILPLIKGDKGDPWSPETASPQEMEVIAAAAAESVGPTLEAQKEEIQAARKVADTAYGVALGADVKAIGLLDRMSRVEGTANGAMAQAQSNYRLLTDVEGLATGAAVQADNNYKLITDVEARARRNSVYISKVYNIEDFEEPEQIKFDDYLFLRTGQTDADSKKLPWWRLYCGNGQFGASPAFSGKIALDDMIPVLRHGVANTDFSKMQASSIAGQNLYASFADIDDFKAVRAVVDALRARLDALVEGNATEVIDTFREIEAFLAGVTNADTLTGLLHEQRQAIDAELDDKADRSELSNVVADDEPLLPGNFPEVDVYTREQLKMDLFVDMWTNRGHGWSGYNAQTDLFWLNEIHDITYEEALTIYNASFPEHVGVMAQSFYNHTYPNCRTLFAVKGFGQNDASGLYGYCTGLEHVLIIDGYHNYSSPGASYKSIKSMFAVCPNLKKIIGTMELYSAQTATAFNTCSALEHVSIKIAAKQTHVPLDFSYSPLLSFDSIKYIVDNIDESASATITLHPEAFARLTEEVMEQAAARQITFVTA